MTCSGVNFTFYIICENYNKERSKKAGRNRETHKENVEQNRRKENIIKVWKRRAARNWEWGRKECNNRIFERNITRVHCCATQLYRAAQLSLLSHVLYIAPPQRKSKRCPVPSKWSNSVMSYVPCRWPQRDGHQSCCCRYCKVVTCWRGIFVLCSNPTWRHQDSWGG